jgi:hypothetical protein
MTGAARSPSKADTGSRMPRENVDLFRRTVEAYNARDIDAFIALFDPDVEFHSSFAGVGAVPRARGAPEVASRPRGDLGRRHPHGAGGLLRPRRVHAHPERPAWARTAQRGGGRNGRCVGSAVRDGLIVYMKSYVSKEEALSDLGVSEDALDAVSP